MLGDFAESDPVPERLRGERDFATRGFAGSDRLCRVKRLSGDTK
jgi:hypothetical protein